jgi:hypothetical protein
MTFQRCSSRNITQVIVALSSKVTVEQQCVPTMTLVPTVTQQCLQVIVTLMLPDITATIQRVPTMVPVPTVAQQRPWSCGLPTSYIDMHGTIRCSPTLQR